MIINGRSCECRLTFIRGNVPLERGNSTTTAYERLLLLISICNQYE